MTPCRVNEWMVLLRGGGLRRERKTNLVEYLIVFIKLDHSADS
jgi:hypothetical protein